MAIIKICLGISGIQTPIEMSAFISLMKNEEDKKLQNSLIEAGVEYIWNTPHPALRISDFPSEEVFLKNLAEYVVNREGFSFNKLKDLIKPCQDLWAVFENIVYLNTILKAPEILNPSVEMLIRMELKGRGWDQIKCLLKARLPHLKIIRYLRDLICNYHEEYDFEIIIPELIDYYTALETARPTMKKIIQEIICAHEVKTPETLRKIIEWSDRLAEETVDEESEG